MRAFQATCEVNDQWFAQAFVPLNCILQRHFPRHERTMSPRSQRTGASGVTSMEEAQAQPKCLETEIASSFTGGLSACCALRKLLVGPYVTAIAFAPQGDFGAALGYDSSSPQRDLSGDMERLSMWTPGPRKHSRIILERLQLEHCNSLVIRMRGINQTVAFGGCENGGYEQ
jgi:hypothetical protein